MGGESTDQSINGGALHVRLRCRWFGFGSWLARLGKVTGISSVLVPAPTTADLLLPLLHCTNNHLPSISPEHTAGSRLHDWRRGMDGGFNGISKPAVARGRRKAHVARRGFIRNHKFIFTHRADRCLSPYLPSLNYALSDNF